MYMGIKNGACDHHGSIYLNVLGVLDDGNVVLRDNGRSLWLLDYGHI